MALEASQKKVKMCFDYDDEYYLVDEDEISSREFYNMLNKEEKIKVKNKLAEKHGGEKEHYTIIDFDMLEDEEVSWKLTDTQVIVFGIIAGLAILVTNLLLGFGVYAWSKKCL